MDVKQRAVNYLNIKPCTKLQLSRYLAKKGYEEDEIRETVKELEEYHYLDDLRYSRMYFEYGFEKGRGVARIKRELAEKGVDSDVVAMAFDELEESEAIPNQLEMALEIAREMISGLDTESLDYDEKRKLQAKIGRRLMGRGFASDVVYKVINKVV